jgi:hypothetical protein
MVGAKGPQKHGSAYKVLFMNEVLSNEINRLEKAFERVGCDTPFLKPAVNALKEVMISRIILKARLSDQRQLEFPSDDN